MTDATACTQVAPQVKSLPDTVGAAFDDFMAGFEAFKAVNDRRLAEIETRLGSDVLTRDKLERINRAMDEQKSHLDRLLLTRNRPALETRADTGLDDAEHKAALAAYLRRGEEQGLREIEAKAFAGTSGPEGGYLLPEERAAEIGTRRRVLAPMRQIASVQTISSAVLKKPFATTGVATGWVSETAARPTTNTPTLAELTFPAMELYAAPAATQGLLDDSAVDIEAWIAGEIDIAFAEQEAAAFISGDGINRPKGLLMHPTVADASWAWGSLGLIATGVPGGFKASNPSDTLVDLIYSLKAGYRQNGRFLMNRKVQAEVRKFKDTAGNYLWQPPASVGEAASLMGFAITEAEEMPDLAANSLSIAFGDFRAGYLIVDRTGIRVLRDPYSAKPYVLFYTTKRVGGGVQNFEAIKLLKFG